MLILPIKLDRLIPSLCNQILLYKAKAFRAPSKIAFM